MSNIRQNISYIPYEWSSNSGCNINQLVGFMVLAVFNEGSYLA